MLQQERTMPRLRKPGSPRPLIDRKERMRVSDGAWRLCLVHATCGSGYPRPGWLVGVLHAVPQLQTPGTRRHSENAPPCVHATSAGSPCQWSDSCAPKTGGVDGCVLRSASEGSCAVWLLLLRVCELAAVGSGISSGESTALSRLRRAVFSRSDSTSRASLAAKESANRESDRCKTSLFCWRVAARVQQSASVLSVFSTGPSVAPVTSASGIAGDSDPHASRPVRRCNAGTQSVCEIFRPGILKPLT